MDCKENKAKEFDLLGKRGSKALEDNSSDNERSRDFDHDDDRFYLRLMKLFVGIVSRNEIRVRDLFFLFRLVEQPRTTLSS